MLMDFKSKFFKFSTNKLITFKKVFRGKATGANPKPSCNHYI